MFSDHHHYREYQRLLVELHGLIAAGKNQSVDSREIRNLMEHLEANLSEEEIVRLNYLSADLSMLHNREIPDPEIVSRVPANEVPRMIEWAFKMKRWEEFLELLRAGVSQLWKPDQIAYVRARAYEGLGEFSPAIAFMDEAARRRPTNASYRSLALRLLWESGRYEDAYDRARVCLEDSSTKARLVIMAAGIVAQRAMRIPEPANLNAVAAVAVSRVQQALAGDSSPNLNFVGQVSLGLLALQLDHISEAATAFSDALQAETTSEQQVTSALVLTRELELVRSGKAKTPEERLNARQLVDFIQLSHLAAAA